MLFKRDCSTKMRVIAGTAKGHALKCPKEPRIRPTADRVREAIFSALESADTCWSRILDLYAGTGALGIEALSRGADEADFVEKNFKCCSVIRENLEHTGLTEKANIYRLDAVRALRSLARQYTLIFMDPPYSDPAVRAMIGKVVTSGLVGDLTTIVLEHSSHNKPEVRYGDFRLTRSLHHGDTLVSIFQHTGEMN